jgi:hypothetical protein
VWVEAVPVAAQGSVATAGVTCRLQVMLLTAYYADSSASSAACSQQMKIHWLWELFCIVAVALVFVHVNQVICKLLSAVCCWRLQLMVSAVFCVG